MTMTDDRDKLLWDRVDKEIRDWFKRESEGRFGTIDDISMDGRQLVFELGRLVGTRWVSDENATYVIGGYFPNEKEALAYVEKLRLEATTIEGHATRLIGPGHESE